VIIVRWLRYMVIRSAFSKSIVKETIMPRKARRPDVELTTQQGNPANAIKSVYPQLMAIDDTNELVQFALQTVEPLVGHGMSPANYAKFVKNLEASSKKGVTDVKFFLTNFLLAADNQSVINPGGPRVFKNSIEAIAACIAEDLSDPYLNQVEVLTPRQQELKFLIESHTDFIVVFS